MNTLKLWQVCALSFALTQVTAVEPINAPITQAKKDAWQQFKQTRLQNYVPTYRAGTTLSAGDIAIVQYNADNTDNFAFVLLTNIGSGTKIYFTDNGWKSDNTFRANENTITWTAPSDMNAGTVVTLTSGRAFLALSNKGDQILAYQVTTQTSTPTFIYALNAEGNAVWQPTASDSNTSALPQGLTNGTNAVALPEKDNYAYTGVTTGDAATLLAAISNQNNWTGHNSNAQTAPASFTVNGGSTPTTPQAGDTRDYTPGTLLTTDNSDASTAIKIDANHILVGDDEASELRVYPVAGGDAVATWSYYNDLGLNGDELDLEASAKIGGTYYFIGSHSNKSNGNDEVSRERLFAVTVSGTGSSTAFTFSNAYSGLISALNTNFPTYGFSTSAADGIKPESKSGFSIEGMTETSTGELLIGFRAPQADTTSRDKAIVVTLTNPAAVLTGTAPTFSPIKTLDLGGRGIRSMYTRGANDYLIIAGPSGSPNEQVVNDFALFTWDGTGVPEQLDNDLDSLRATTKGSFETIVDVDASGLVHLLQDNGDTVWAGKTKKSKKLPAGEQKFVGNWLQLGNSVTDNTPPQLVSSLPVNNATNIGTQDVTITLTFDEYVKAGTGNFTLSGGASPIVIPVANATINGGVVSFTVPVLAENTAYTVTVDTGALKDTSDNNWTGFGTYQFTTFASATTPSHTLLITEVNSKSTGEDFFELYNYGDTDIDLSGWKWYDKDLDDTKKQTFPAGTVVKAKKTLVVAVTDNEQIFRNAWGAQLNAAQPVMAISEEPGLGKDDAVVIFNAAGKFVTGMNYGASLINYAGGTLNPAQNPSGTNAASGEHAGKSFDANVNNEASAVWDGQSDSDPRYTAAVDGTNDAGTQTGDANSVGSPGNVTDNVLRITKIHAIQGTADQNAMDGQTVTIEGIVVGDFQDGDGDQSRNLRGFYVQEEDADKDTDPKTSEGIFVYEGSGNTANDVNVGDKVQVTGTVDEYFDETQLKSITTIKVVSQNNALPVATAIRLPAAATTVSQAGKAQPDLEAYEGMLVTFPDTLTISEMYQLARFNEIKLTQGGRPKHFTQNNTPDVTGYAAHLKSIGARTITYDDGLNKQNAPIGYLDGFGPTFSTATNIRMGDTIKNLSGVLSYQWAGDKRAGKATWRVRATQNGENKFTKVNQRSATPPTVGGSLKVASFNVENYFTSIDDRTAKCGPSKNMGCRGADSQDEFTRQRAKTVKAISLMDADIIGLMELENTDDVAIQNLVDGLNDEMGANTYDYVNSGIVGSDVIRVGLVYKPAKVALEGSHAILDSSVDPNFIDTKNRPVLAQTFKEIATDEKVTVAIVHFKSKGSSCANAPLNDRDLNDGQANCNLTRTKASNALKRWLATDPTNGNTQNSLLLGDFNAYAMEDPITALEQNDDYTNLIKKLATQRSAQFSTLRTPTARRYVFDAQLGTLDYAFANATLLPKVTGAEEWHINGDEPSAIDYNLDYGRDGTIFDGTVPYRTSDHDPILVGLTLNTVPKVDITPNPVPTTVTNIGVGKAVDLVDFTVSDEEDDDLVVTLLPTNGTISGVTDSDAATAGVQLTGKASVINSQLMNVMFTAVAAGDASIKITPKDKRDGEMVEYKFKAFAKPTIAGVPATAQNVKLAKDEDLADVTITSTVSSVTVTIDTTGLNGALSGYEVTKLTGSVSAVNAELAKLQFKANALGATSFKFTVNNGLNDEVSATYPLNVTGYKVTIDTDNNGTVTAQDTSVDLDNVAHDSTPVLVATPNAGFELATISGCGATTTDVSPFTTGAVTSACTVTATFTKKAIDTKPLTFTSPNTLTGKVGEAFSSKVAVTGGKAPLQYSATNLPTGLSIDVATGNITGTPTTAGKTDVTVSVTDANGKTATQVISVTITDDTTGLSLEDVKDQMLKVGDDVNISLVATGGTGNYTFSIDGTLPKGLTLDNGKIVGKVTEAGMTEVTIKVTDGKETKTDKAKFIVAKEGLIFVDSFE